MAASKRISKEEGKIKLDIALNTGKEKPTKTDLSIYLTVDTSGSMSGSKLNQVITSVKEIVEKAPNHARFIVRSFGSDTKTLVSKRKKYLDAERVFNELNAPGGRTVLFDAWYKTLKEIPYADFKTNRIFVLVFTDGDDNASNATLAEVIEETEKFLKKPDVYFTFIQAGNESRSVQALRQKYGGIKRCKILEVEDSAKGIQFAFNTVKRHMQELRFHIELCTSDPTSLAQSLTGLKISTSTAGKAGSEVGVQIRNARPTKEVRTGWNSGPPNLRQGHMSGADNSWRTQSLLGPPPPPIAPLPVRNTGGSAIDALAMRHGWPVENFAGPNNIQQSSGMNQGRNNLGGSNSCIRVSNIPLHLTPGEVATVFSRFGRCFVMEHGFEVTSQWVLLQFDHDMAVRAALREPMDLHGSTLKISAGRIKVYDSLK